VWGGLDGVFEKKKEFGMKNMQICAQCERDSNTHTAEVGSELRRMASGSQLFFSRRRVVFEMVV
jgi:hypothetical protein